MKRSFFSLLSIAIVLLVQSISASPAVSLQVVDHLDLPCDISALTPTPRLEVALAVGEYESIALLVSTAKSLDNEVLKIKGLPRGVSVEKRVATPYRRKLRQNREVTQPYMLEVAPRVSVKAAEKAVYWLTFKAEPNAKPGRYDLTIGLSDASAKVSMSIRSYRLRRDPKVIYGAFCGGGDRAITFEHMKDLHERGFDALQFFWGSVSMPLENDSGRLKADFSFVDKWMADFQRAGMRGPVVWSMGNDSKSHMENKLSDVFQIPRPPPVRKAGKMMDFADIHNPELNRRVKELMLAIKEHAAEKKWPEIIFIIYDEPTERLMEEHENRYRFLKSFWPELRIYGVTMNRIEWAKAINHMVDIFVANGDFQEISALGEQSGKPFWLYGSASSRNQTSLRHSYAWRPWQHSAQGVWFWAYNYRAGDPYNDFDSRSPDSSRNMVWPARTPDGPLVYSVSWDGMREAADDMAYLKTLEWMLSESKSRRAREIQRELAALKDEIPSGVRVRVLGGDAHDRIEKARARAKKFVQDSRRRVAAWIEELLSSEKDLFQEIRVE
jgi:hypothetical protein